MIKELMKQIYGWVAKLPGWVKVISGCLTGIVTIVITLREHFNLLIVVAILFALIFLTIILFIITFARKKSSYGDAVIFRYPRYRKMGLYGGIGMIVFLCLLGALQPSRSFFIGPFIASDSVAQKIDIIEVRFPPKQAEIVIGEFKISNSLGTIEVAQRIKDELEKRLGNYRSSGDIKILKLDSVIGDQQKAVEIASAHKAKAVVWGWVDAGDIRIHVLMPAPGKSMSISNPETHLSIAGPEQFEGTLQLIRQDVTANIAFLSLYILGYQFYLSNHYRQGVAILDEALKLMPKSASPEFQSLIHFFKARELQIRNSMSDSTFDDNAVRDIVRGYAKAIESNPRFSLAYNNLGVLFSSLFIPAIDAYHGDEGEFLAEHDYGVLKKRSLLFNELGSYFDLAIRYDPNVALFRANRWCLYYQINGRYLFDFVGGRIVLSERTVLDSLSRAAVEDPSLPGVQIALGAINFDIGNLEAALKNYERAEVLIKDNWELEFNLAQTYRRLGFRKKAIAKFQKLLLSDSTDYESNIALAAMHIEAKNYSEAVNCLKQYESQVGPEAILYSEILFRQGKSKDALHVLSALFPTTVETGHGDISVYDASLGFCLIKAYIQLLGLKDEYNWRPSVDCEEEILDNYFDNNTEALALGTIIKRCKPKYDEQAPWKSNCLAVTPEGRIDAIFHIFHQWLACRNFLRTDKISYDMGACPFLFTRSDDQEEWQLETTIITNMRGIENEGISRSALKTFSGTVLIREIESERSFLDFIRIRLQYPDGTERILYPTLKPLQPNDGRVLGLNQGDALIINFDGDYEKAFSKVFVEAKGYYIPIREKHLNF